MASRAVESRQGRWLRQGPAGVPAVHKAAPQGADARRLPHTLRCGGMPPPREAR